MFQAVDSFQSYNKKRKKNLYIKDLFLFTLKCRDRLYKISDIKGEHSDLINKCYRKEKIKYDSKLKSEM